MKAASAVQRLHPGLLWARASVSLKDLMRGWRGLSGVGVCHLSPSVRKLSPRRGKRPATALLQGGGRADSRRGSQTTAWPLFHCAMWLWPPSPGGLQNQFPKHPLKGHYHFCKYARVVCQSIPLFTTLESLSKLSHGNRRHNGLSFSRFLSTPPPPKNG